jgi:tripeptidyl-peptidase-1
MRLLALALSALTFSAGVLAADPYRAKSTGVWTQKHRAHASEKVTVGFVLKQNNLDQIEELFWDRTNPKSDNYGKWLSKKEIGAIVHNKQAHESVLKFLQDHDIAIVHDNENGEYVRAEMSVAQAEKIFQTEFHSYVSPHHKDTVVRTTEFTVPEDLEMHLHHVEHISHFPSEMTRPMFGKMIPNSLPTHVVTPALIYKTYGIPTTLTASSTSGATQSLFESLGQSFAPDDLTMFQQKYSLEQVNVSRVIGPNNPDLCQLQPDNCGEANLDVEYIMAVAQGAQTVYWYAPGLVEPFVDWIMTVANETTPPLVHSISYGGYESENTDANKDSFNTEAMKLGLRGVSIIVASGDDGAVNYKVRSDPSACGYFTSFPSSSPYVTSVGATSGPEAGTTEVACSSDTGGLITTGGGFSTYFSIPAYQKTQVSEYLSSVKGQIASGYPTTGRGSPDVAIMGHNYAITIGGEWTAVSGTSASAPVFAGMITLINDYRLTNGKSALGFLNQALYQLDSTTWKDITSGNNKCSAEGQTGENCCSEGFIATTGWDPLTGLGTPHFPALKSGLGSL